MSKTEEVPRIKIVKCQKGFTLVETLFVVLILPVIFLGLYGVVDLSQTIFQTNTVFAQMNQSAMQSLRNIGRELGETSSLSDPAHLAIATDVNGDSILDFQIPVDWDGDGDVYSGTLAPVTEWGAYHHTQDIENAELDGWVRYSMTNSQLIREVLDDALTSVAGTSKVIANDVAGFTVTQNSDRVTMTLDIAVTDNVGRKGVAVEHTLTFTNETFLRNSVD